ncbi:BnaAnng39670D, partial [Brassica napus]
MERSEEQFVKERDVTRRNGEPASQVTTVEGGLEVGRWSQGFLAVGMLRDSRALRCFGSNGEEEVRGEVRGMGEMVGEGVGEREGAAKVVDER